MKLSTRCRYGVRAMLEIARRVQGGPVKRREIAGTQDVTEAYLENILGALKRQGFVKTLRGAEGGFVLARPAAQIALYDIVVALEGSIAPVDCIENIRSCDRAPACAARKVWQDLFNAQREALQKVSLEDMVRMEVDPKGMEYCI